MARKGFYIGNQRVPGVTTVIGSVGWNKEVLNRWAFGEGKRILSKLVTKVIYKGEQAGIDTASVMQTVQAQAKDLTLNDITDKAKEEGLCLHEMVDCFIKNIPFDPTPYSDKALRRMSKGFNNFKTYINKSNLKFTNAEFDVLSPTLMYGCRIDFEAKEGGDLIIGDLKTGKGVYPDHIIQLAGCYFAYGETYGQLPLKAIVIVVNKDTGEVKRADLDRGMLTWGYEVFKLARQLHNLKNSAPRIWAKKV